MWDRGSVTLRFMSRLLDLPLIGVPAPSLRKPAVAYLAQRRGSVNLSGEARNSTPPIAPGRGMSRNMDPRTGRRFIAQYTPDPRRVLRPLRIGCHHRGQYLGTS